MKLTGAAILVSRGVKVLQAARQLILVVRPQVNMEDDFSEFPVTCPIHGCKLVPGTAPIVYGFFTHSPEYGQAWKSRFRQSNAWYAGSCAIGQKTVADIKYCEKCRKAESQWLEEQLRDGIDPRCFEWWLAKKSGLVKCNTDIDSDTIAG